MIPSILVTGFGPFPGVPRNPSQVVVERLAASLARHGPPIACTAILPTEYEGAAIALSGLLRAVRPRTLLLTGVATGERCYRVERRAANLDDSDRPDAAGEVRRAQKIAAGGPAAYEAGAVADGLVTVLGARGLSARESDDAGGYVCNHAYYVARHLAAYVRCAFVHLPGEQSALGDPERAAEALLDCARALDG